MTEQHSYNINLSQPSLEGDIIENFPVDQTIPSHNEIRIVDTLFKKKKSLFDRILQHTKDILIIGALFVIFSLPFIDGLIKKFIPITNKSQYIFIGIKTLMFMFSYFLIHNLYLARKQ